MKFIIHILLLLLSLPVMAQEDDVNDPGYHFDKYAVDMTVHEDNTIDVVENIDVFFTLKSRGIYRLIPTNISVKRDMSSAQNESQTRIMKYMVNVKNVDVSENWSEMEYSDGVYGMRIGNPDVYITGRHKYTISYRIEIPGDRVSQGDLFYYSVLGSGWECRTDTFNFAIHFDKALSSKELQAIKVFMGNEDDATSEQNVASAVLKNVTSKLISGSATDIYPYSAVTLFVPLHEGYFVSNGHPEMEIMITYVFLALSLLLLIYILYREIFVRTNYTKVISFYPPKGCSSLDVGTIIDTSVDDQDVISLIPWFAQQGYLTIDNTGDHPILHKVKDIPENSPRYQKTLFNGFFQKGDTFDLGNVNKSFGSAWINAKSQAESSFSSKLTKLDKTSAWLLVIDIFFVCMATCWATNDNAGMYTGGWLSLLFWVAAGFSIFSGMTKGRKLLTAEMAGSIIFLFFAYGTLYIGYYDDVPDPWLLKDPTLLYIALGGVGLAILLASSLTVMTEYRRRLIGQILGLHEFICTAEKQQLEQLQAQDEKYFYNVLPYAVAFGMAEQWAKRFDGIKIGNVDWYRGADRTLFGLAAFNRRSIMKDSLMSSIKSEQSKRAELEHIKHASSGSSFHSSSSHSSGGYSGGGFGGGGGGRW